MFAVPGWSLPQPELQPQKDPSAVTEAPPKENVTPERNVRSRKRKRAREAETGGGKITKANISEMWSRYIEGQPPKKGKAEGGKTQDGQKKKKPKKKQEQGAAEGSSHEEAGAVADKKDNNSVTATIQKPKLENQDGGGSKRKRKSNHLKPPSNDQSTGTTAPSEALPPVPPSTAPTLTPLQQSMRQKLVSARFRHLNQTLYTTPSAQALELFTANPELFDEYHAGFSRQVKESWPSNPVDSYIQAVNTRGTTRPQHRGQKRPVKGQDQTSEGPQPLPRRPQGLCTIIDLGCGDAQFARSLMSTSKKMKVKLLNYDLHNADPLITKADISNLPLEDGTVDIAVFCLSLMGTNWVSFVEEAWRVLRGDGKGECWVSEVKSRFGKPSKKAQAAAKARSITSKKDKPKKKGKGNDPDEDDAGDDIFAEDSNKSAAAGDETDITAFVDVFRTRGFALKPQSVDKSNKMFVKMEFIKVGAPTKGKWAITADNSARYGKPNQKRFLEADSTSSGLTPEEESSVLKPCVYKKR